MKRWLVVGLLVLTGAGPASDLLACGDKFLVISRGTRYQRAAFRRPANILIYANATSTLTQSLGNVPVAATLSKVGYRTTTEYRDLYPASLVVAAGALAALWLFL